MNKENSLLVDIKMGSLNDLSLDNFNKFEDEYHLYEWSKVMDSIYSKSTNDVLNALSKDNRNLDDFKALISPNALKFLPDMVSISQQITQKRFGKTVQLYIPLYLSNECNNICTYCGFSFENKLPRKTLNFQEILKEVEIIKAMGFKHILLVTGEENKKVNAKYLCDVVTLLKPFFSQISIEVQPLENEEYKDLIEKGVHSVLIYQETYNKDVYKKIHLKGKKSNFSYRINTPERICKLGIHKLGIGVLLGLTDWRVDSFFNVLHLEYLQKLFWKTKFSISFPRLRPYSGGEVDVCEMKDKELIQLICAYRLLNENLELSISTRESEKFRDNIFKMGITSMSANSKTNPGGYALGLDSLEQFEISDERSYKEIEKIIINGGYEPVWKDWDKIY